jgi:hypothetical protein
MALASDSLDEEKKKKNKKKGAAQGAIGGATTGASGGPVGAIAGAAIGAGTSLVESNQAEKAAASAGRPERRALTAGRDAMKDTKRRKEQALATLSQAVFDWAAAIR